MKKLCLICLAIFLTLTISSCNSDNEQSVMPDVSTQISEENPFEIGGGSNSGTITIGYKFGLSKYPDEWVYSGKPIEFEMYYQNGSFDIETGFFIFVDGIVQQYSINDQSDLQYMHKFNLKANERLVTRITFKPNTGKKGEKVNIQFASLLEPSFVTNQNESYGNNHSLLELSPSTIRFEESAASNDYSVLEIENAELLNSEFLSRYAMTSATDADTHIVRLYDVFNDPDIFSKENHNATLTFEDFGGAGCDYRTTVFVDNVPIQIDGKYDYAEYYLKDGCFVNQTLNIPIDNSSEKHSVYAISVPTSINSSGMICASNSSTIFPIGTQEITPSSPSEVTTSSEAESSTVIPAVGGNNAVIPTTDKQKDITERFGGLVGFCVKIGNSVYTIEDYNKIVKYSESWQNLKSVELNPDRLYLFSRPLTNKIAVFSQSLNGQGMFCTVYDEELNSEDIDVFSVVGKNPQEDYIFPTEIDISPDGKKLVLIDYNTNGDSSIFQYSVKGGEPTMLYSNENFGIANIRYAADGKIACISDDYSSGSRREYICVLSANGDKLAEKNFDNAEYAGSAGDYLIFDDRNVVDGKHTLGMVYLYSDGDKFEEISLNSLDESQHAFVAADGSVITYVENNSTVKFFVYKNGKLAEEWDAEFSDGANAQIDLLSIIGENKIIVAYFTGMKQHIVEYQF